MKNLLYEIWKKRRCVKGNPKENHPLRSLVWFINNIKTQLQPSQATALEFGAWIGGSLAGSWGSPATHHGRLPPAGPCRGTLPADGHDSNAFCGFQSPTPAARSGSTVTSLHPPAALVTATKLGNCTLYFCQKPTHPSQLLQADVAKAHSIPSKQLSLSTAPLFSAMNPLWIVKKVLNNIFMKKYFNPWMVY